MKLYRCDDTGIILEEINNYDNGLEISLCAIKDLTPKEHEEGLSEKHIPVYERNDNDLIVKVGSIPHPMTDDHYIEYIELETNKGTYRKYLEDEPKVIFKLEDNEKVQNIYSYCNIHGLWVSKRKEESVMKRYKCNTCGNVIEMINDSGVIPHCCGKEMEEVKKDS